MHDVGLKLTALGPTPIPPGFQIGFSRTAGVYPLMLRRSPAFILGPARSIIPGKDAILRTNEEKAIQDWYSE